MLLVASALAADPADGVAAAAIDVAVEASAPIIDSPSWFLVPDAMEVEIELARGRVPIGEAVAVTVSATDPLRVDRVALDGSGTRALVDTPRRRGCGAPSETGTWTDDRAILTYEAESSVPGIVLVDDHAVGAVVGLAPGESVVVQTVRVGGEIVRESLSLRRAGGEITVRRGTWRERVCASVSAP